MIAEKEALKDLVNKLITKDIPPQRTIDPIIVGPNIERINQPIGNFKPLEKRSPAPAKYSNQKSTKKSRGRSKTPKRIDKRPPFRVPTPPPRKYNRGGNTVNMGIGHSSPTRKSPFDVDLRYNKTEWDRKKPYLKMYNKISSPSRSPNRYEHNYSAKKRRTNTPNRASRSK